MCFKYSRKFLKCVVCQLQTNKLLASVLSFIDFLSTEKLTPQRVNSLHPHAHMHPITACYRGLSDSSQKRASHRLERTPSTALAAPERAVWCVSGSWRAALILIDPHGWHRRSPPTNQNKQTGEKHCNCQKWHNEDNESTSLTAEHAHAICGHEAQSECWDFLPWPLLENKMRVLIESWPGSLKDNVIWTYTIFWTVSCDCTLALWGAAVPITRLFVWTTTISRLYRGSPFS